MGELTPEYLLAALRQVIKTKGLTYRSISESVGTPLSTFKRHMSSTNLTIDRLLEYCRVVDCSLSELQKIASQLVTEDQNYFSHTQDRAFLQSPELYDFYQELRVLRDNSSYSTLMNKYHLNERSMADYLKALSMLDLVQVEGKENITLQGSLFYRYADNSQLSQRYTQILTEQALNQDKSARVVLSRMKVSEKQLLSLEKQFSQEILNYHTENISAEEMDATQFTNIFMLVSPHEPITFSNGIKNTNTDFMTEFCKFMASSREKLVQNSKLSL